MCNGCGEREPDCAEQNQESFMCASGGHPAVLFSGTERSLRKNVAGERQEEVKCVTGPCEPESDWLTLKEQGQESMKAPTVRNLRFDLQKLLSVVSLSHSS